MSRLQAYTADSVALLGYLADQLPTRVDKIFKMAEDGEALLTVPSIVIGETLFTLLKGREIFGVEVPIEKLAVLLNILETCRTIRLMDLGVEGWRLVMGLNLPELHDRMVVATHKLSGSKAILTNDKEILGLKDVETIWE